MVKLKLNFDISYPSLSHLKSLNAVALWCFQNFVLFVFASPDTSTDHPIACVWGGINHLMADIYSVRETCLKIFIIFKGNLSEMNNDVHFPTRDFFTHIFHVLDPLRNYKAEWTTHILNRYQSTVHFIILSVSRKVRTNKLALI